MPSITVTTTINSSIDKVWNAFITPEDIMQWNNASPDWHTPKASNNFIVGGEFSYTMAAKDGSFSFDFWGVYDNIIPHKLIEYTLGDGRKVSVVFEENNNAVMVTETFEAESINPIEMQEAGWQAILNNFKNHLEIQ
ncbi:MAG: hypothetical protein C0459_14560 [Chitinophaga sp.]|jgi:uncharacterized protein YndB with AHSA1/START domain|nr:hypothetical protein [Chitinophaga sp.]